MEYSHNIDNSICEFAMSGKFTFSDHEKFRQILQEIASADVATVIFDFNNITFIDSAGLGMLLMAKEEADKKKLPVKLKNTRTINKILTVSRFDNLFEIE